MIVDGIMMDFLNEFESITNISFGSNPCPTSTGVYFKTYDIKYWLDSHQIELNNLMVKYEGKIQAYIYDYEKEDDRKRLANIALSIK